MLTFKKAARCAAFCMLGCFLATFSSQIPSVGSFSGCALHEVEARMFDLADALDLGSGRLPVAVSHDENGFLALP